MMINFFLTYPGCLVIFNPGFKINTMLEKLVINFKPEQYNYISLKL
jgi:hypothetical protein